MAKAPPARLRADFVERQHFGHGRSIDRIRAHYVLERELSNRLRNTPREGRSAAYAEVYNELFAKLPDHIQWQRVHTANRLDVEVQLRRVIRNLGPNSTFLEIGCGDAALAIAAAPSVLVTYALDISDALINFAAAPPNFQFLRTPGLEIQLPDGSVDFVYSNSLMEHLHPDDAADQLSEVYRVLKPNGRYMCITPSRVTGPHDISRYFDYEATGLHLKEYDYGALRGLFSQVGFRTFACSAMVRGREIWLPYRALRAAECLLLVIPAWLRASLTRFGPTRALFGLNVVAEK